MTNKRLLPIVVVLLALTGYALAQTTNTPPATGGTGLPQTTQEYWVLAIAALTPLIVTGVRKAVPNIPSVLLPVSTPVLGIVLGLVANKVLSANLNWVDTAQAGALAVFIRETWNQAITKRMQPPDPGASTTTTSTGTVAAK